MSGHTTNEWKGTPPSLVARRRLVSQRSIFVKVTVASELIPSGQEQSVKMETITSDMTVEYVLEKWPETAPVFNHDLKTACVGCPIAPFDTLEDIARIYDLDLNWILTQLQKTAGHL